MKKFELARRAVADLQEIWEFVPEHSFTAADRLLEEFDTTFGQLAEMPGLGHNELTFRVTTFCSGGCILTSSFTGRLSRFA